MFKDDILKMFQTEQDRLRKATWHCSLDMHDPVKQNVDAVFSGFKFDNSYGNHPYHNMGEMTVGIHNINTGNIEWFNLANLIAIARWVRTEDS